MDKLSALFYIFLTLMLGAYGQIVMKWQISLAGSLPDKAIDKLYFVLLLLLNPWIISSLVGAFLAMICWMMALTKVELSYAYPFTSISFVLILALSAIFFNEPVTLHRVGGVLLIMLGVWLASV